MIPVTKGTPTFQCYEQKMRLVFLLYISINLMRARRLTCVHISLLQARNGGIVMVNFYSDFVQCNKSKNATIDDVIGE